MVENQWKMTFYPKREQENKPAVQGDTGGGTAVEEEEEEKKGQ